MTSAPWAASVRPHTGPAMMRVRSTTLMPLSGRSAAAKRCRRRVADPLDGEQRQVRDRAALRMAIPFVERSARGDDEARLGGGGFQRLALPAVKRALHGGFIVRALQQRQQAAAMMRQIGVQPHPAAVAAAIKPGDVVVIFLVRFAVDLQIALAAEFDGRMAHVDADVLPLAGAQPPQICGRQRGSGNRRLRGSSGGEGGGQYRLAAGEADVVQHRIVETGRANEAGENDLTVGSCHPRIIAFSGSHRE